MSQRPSTEIGSNSQSHVVILSAGHTWLLEACKHTNKTQMEEMGANSFCTSKKHTMHHLKCPLPGNFNHKALYFLHSGAFLFTNLCLFWTNLLRKCFYLCEGNTKIKNRVTIGGYQTFYIYPPVADFSHFLLFMILFFIWERLHFKYACGIYINNKWTQYV